MTTPRHFTLAITPESVARWQIARDDALAAPPAPGSPVPMSWFVFLRMQPLLGLSIHEWLGRDPDRGLYGGVSYRRRGAALCVGDTVQAESDVADRRQVDSPRGVLTVTTLTTTYRAGHDGELTESVRMIDLPPRDAAVAPPAEEPAAVATRPEGHVSWCTLRGLSRRQLAWMTVETGDLNPLHLDPGHAARRGFADVVAPAPLVTACIELALSARLPGAVSGLDVRFQAPVHPEAEIELWAREGGDRVDFQAVVGGRTRVEGRMLLATREST